MKPQPLPDVAPRDRTATARSFASSTTTDYTDLWYNPAEAGWGANVVQQGSTMFITFFVYGSNSQPTW